MLSKGNHAHYEKGMEEVLRKSHITYISTYERKMALLKNGKKLKNFDVVLLSKDAFIIDFKGKQFSYPGASRNIWENWLPVYHIQDLITWQAIFKSSKSDVMPLLVFVYKLNRDEDKVFFKDIYFFEGVSYGVVAIEPKMYLKHSKPRGKGKIYISRKKFPTLVKPLSFYVPAITYN